MLEIKLLDTLDVRVDGEPVHLNSRKADRLLALLVLENGRRLQRQWVEVVLDMSYESLRKSESALRAALGSESARLHAANNTLLMDLTNVQVDLFEFERLVHSSELENLDRAIALYRGDLLQGWDAVWLSEKRDEVQEACLEALRRGARQAIDLSGLARAATYMRRFLRICPIIDAGWAQLIEIYRMMDRSDLAAKAWAGYNAMLDLRRKRENRDL